MKNLITVLLISVSLMANSQTHEPLNEGHTTMAFLAFTTSTFVGSISSLDKQTGLVNVKKGVLIQFATGTGIAILKEILLDGLTNYNPASLRDFSVTMIGVGVGTILTTVFLRGASKSQGFKM